MRRADAVYVAVVGTGRSDRRSMQDAEEVGREIAERGGVLVCGGLGGVMEAAARGARSAGGLTVGILPGGREDANDHLDVALATGMGEMRNAVLVRSSDVLIAIGGGYGTLSEIALGLRAGRPVVGLRTWRLGAPGAGGSPDEDQGIVVASSAAEAVARAWQLTGSS